MWLRKEKKKTLKSLIVFLSANEINNYNRGWGMGKKEKKIQKNLQNKSNNKNNKCFSESLLSASFPLLGVTDHLPSLGCPRHCAGLWTCCGGSSDSNLVLLLCVLASHAHSYQSQCLFFCGSSQWPFVYSIDRVCLVDRVDLICNLCPWWGGLGLLP